jgi:hypothetical protein
MALRPPMAIVPPAVAVFFGGEMENEELKKLIEALDQTGWTVMSVNPVWNEHTGCLHFSIEIGPKPPEKN